MFDQQPTPQRQNVNRTVSAPVTAAAAFGSLHANRHHPSSHSTSGSVSPSIQNQRVSQIIRATGHQTSPSTAFTNRFNSSAQNQSLQQFYAPLSSTSVSQQQTRPVRPPVPLFTNGIGKQQNSANMDLQGISTSTSLPSDSLISYIPDALSFEDFTPFEGGATTAYSSPGIPGYDMNVSSGSDSVSNLSTVSPSDLFLQDHFTSAPNSSAITNLTSPSMYGESPDLHDSYEVSPNYGGSDFDHGSRDNWYSLFPDQNAVSDPTPTPASKAEVSPTLESDDFEEAETTTTQSRRKSSHGKGSPSNKPSSVAGVNPRRRDKPLPPIVVEDPHDPVLMKRARNTLAARKSRERKAMRFEELEARITKLEEERDYWKNKALSKTG